MTIGELLEQVKAMNEVMPADTPLFYADCVECAVVFVPKGTGYTVYLRVKNND